MSNSAFTPSTSTVTNNVPTNVPVVTAWTSYTPTLSAGWGATSGLTASWQRVGDSIKIRGYFLGGTAVNAAATVSIPTGLTAGTLPKSGYNIIGKGYRSGLTQTTQSKAYTLLMQSGSNVFGFSFSDNGSSSTTDLIVPQNGTLLMNGDPIHFETDLIPIAEWAGSGTTTLATRAVEEYASNSGAEGTVANTQYLNTSYVVYGPNGSLIPSVNSATSNAATDYIVRFQQAIQPTDTIILEIQQAGSGSWIPVYGGIGGVGMVPYQRQATSYYGIGFNRVTGSSTDIYVTFGNFGARPAGSGATFGSPGDPWSSFTAYRWRLRKVSSGAQVGYPVSARNIVGDTSGTAVPTGMIGEVINGAAVASSVTIGTSSTAVSSIALTPGRWALKYNLSSYVATGATSGNRTYVYFRIRDSADTTTVPLSTKILLCKTVNNVVNDIYSNLAAEVIVDISQNTTYLLRGLRVDTNGTGVATAENDGNATTSNFYAIRIG